jgi:hypothetical protein
MNVKSIARIIGLVSLIITGSVFAQTAVPNTFQSGQAALASEVNANFTTLADAVNSNAGIGTTNATAIQALEGSPDLTGPRLVVMDSNQTEVGSYASLQNNGSNAVVWLEIGSNVVHLFVSKNNIHTSPGAAPMMFESSDCTGAALVGRSNYSYASSNLLNPYEYLVHPDGQTVLQTETDPSTNFQATVASQWMHTSTTCFQFSTPSISGVHTTVAIGLLPIFAPPFSLEIVSDE